MLRVRFKHTCTIEGINFPASDVWLYANVQGPLRRLSVGQLLGYAELGILEVRTPREFRVNALASALMATQRWLLAYYQQFLGSVLDDEGNFTLPVDKRNADELSALLEANHLALDGAKEDQ